MSGIKKERTPEQIEAAKARMAAVRAKKGSKPKPSLKEGLTVKKMIEAKELTVGTELLDVYDDSRKIEHKRAASVPAEFAGMTAKDCCDSCYASNGTRCAITHRGICGHPLKGGLQSYDQMRPDTVARYQKAKKILAHAKIEAA